VHPQARKFIVKYLRKYRVAQQLRHVLHAIVSIPQLQRMGVFQEKTKKIVSIAIRIRRA